MAIYAQSMLRTCICTCQSVQPTTCAASFLLLLESLPDFCVSVLPSSCPSTSQKTIGHLAEDMKKVLLPLSLTYVGITLHVCFIKMYFVKLYHLARKFQDQEQLPWQQICGAAAFFHRNVPKETNKLLIAAGTNKVKGNNNIYTIYTTLLQLYLFPKYQPSVSASL